MPYLIHASVLLACTIGFYWVLLRKETFYKLNRGILLSSILLSLVLPLITVPAQFSIHEAPITYVSNVDEFGTSINSPDYMGSRDILAMSQFDSKSNEEMVLDKSEIMKNETLGRSLSFSNIVWYAYLAGVVIFMLAFLVQFFLLMYRIISLPSIKDDKYRIVELNDDQAPYSFLNCIFINPTKYNWDTYSQILEHEKIHIEQVHFFDKFVAEALLIAFWFNPFAWLYRTVITNNLEYLTDDSMLNIGTEKESYQMSLLEVSVPQFPFTSYNKLQSLIFKK